MKKVTYAIVDCNNFFVSCERVFDPSLEGKPVIVLSNNDGCVISRSQEAKDLGIKMAQPVFECQKIIKDNDVKVYSTNFTLYGDLSARVMDIIKQYIDDTEVYSIDEIFLLFHTKGLATIKKCSFKLKETVKRRTGVPISIGIGPTKTLAKVANKIAKKNLEFGGVFDISSKRNQGFYFKTFDVGDVWGIGRQYKKFLNKNSIYTISDFLKKTEEWVKKHMTVVGLRTFYELRGTSCIELEKEREFNDSIMCSRTFADGLTAISDLKESISVYTARTAEKLRKQNAVASSLSVFLCTNRFRGDFYAKSSNIKLPESTSDTSILTKAALQALKKIFRPGFKYKKAGVMLTGIVPNSYKQIGLDSSDSDNEKTNSLLESIDQINHIWGRSTVKLASEGMGRFYWGKQLNMSKRYTTCWDELLEVSV
jgi:DNA polymerase V